MNLLPEWPPLLALLGGAWLAAAIWATWRARTLAAAARRVLAENQQLAALTAAGPAMPLLVEPDGRLQGEDRLAGALGLEHLPAQWRDFVAHAAIGEDQAAMLRYGIAVAAAGGRFTLSFRPGESRRVFRVEGGPAPAEFPRRTALLWFFDNSDAEEQAGQLRERLDRRSEALEALSRLIELAPFPMWHRGPDLSLTMVNTAYVAAVEADDAQGVVEGQIELVEELPPDRGSSADGEGDRGGQRDVPVTIAGERRMMRIVELPLGPTGIAGYAIDIEDQEEARAALARFARAQHDMLDRLSAGVAQFARDRSLIFFNQPFARMFGLTVDFLGDSPEFERVIDTMREAGNLPEVRDFPEWKAEHREWFTASLEAEEEDWLLPGGRHLRVVAQPLPDGGLLLIFEDRTEQLQLASARDTLLRVRTATFDNLFEAVGVFAADGRLNLWNSRFTELWGIGEDQLAKHPRVDALARQLAPKLRQPRDAGLVRELVRSATQERTQRSGRVAMADGREFEFAAVPLPDGNALFTMLDITDSRRVEAALRDRTEALEEADRLKTAFVANMSYELRTPLTTIAGFAEMLANGYGGKLPKTAADYVTAINESVFRLGALIDNVLDLTQSDMGSLLLAEDDVDLVFLCSEHAAKFADQASEKGIELAVEVEETVGRVTGDTRRLGQALGHVIANAIAYTDSGGQVRLHAEGSADEARITVADNGRGIEATDLARVFDRFRRLMEGQSGSSGSVGLGLPLARQYIEAHGGQVELQSEPGKGTKVTIRLPRTQAQQAEWPVQRAAQ
ncbi:MAG: ATP-binding protein [Sphingosinicella sp.]